MPGDDAPRHGEHEDVAGSRTEPIELVNYILFLDSGGCRCVTGTNHVMDCGRLTLPRQ